MVCALGAGQNGPEIGVDRYDDSTLVLRALEDRRIARLLHAVLAHVDRVMARGAQSGGDTRG